MQIQLHINQKDNFKEILTVEIYKLLATCNDMSE